jgi:GDP-D-mannose 3',5'-epimerase
VSKRSILVCGGGGFIGGHLAKRLLADGHHVRCVDRKPRHEWFQLFEEAENIVADLKSLEACQHACAGRDDVYNLAADMGGMGFIESNKANCMLSVLINTHLLQASQQANVKSYFYASSACVYNGEKQASEAAIPLKEEDAYPAMPEDGYGWEKLFSERMCRHFCEDFGLRTRVTRFHNAYGPYGTWEGGREKAPAALCRKVVKAKENGETEIEIWGDGRQTRTFMYVDDVVHGILAIMASDILEPVNLGATELISIDDLARMIEEIAEVELNHRYNLSAPKGVKGRNSDNTLLEKHLGWSPGYDLREGMEKTYAWIFQEYTKKHAGQLQ